MDYFNFVSHLNTTVPPLQKVDKRKNHFAQSGATHRIKTSCEASVLDFFFLTNNTLYTPALGVKGRSVPPIVNLTTSRWLLRNANEALATETGRYYTNISNGGNAIHHPEFSEAGSEAIVGWSNTELGRHNPRWALNQGIKETETRINRTAFCITTIGMKN